jgi:dolichol-phosphate mannosyltransferase
MLLDRNVVNTINNFGDQDVFLRGTVRWFGYPTRTITFSRGSRTYGESKYTLKRMVDLAVTGIAAHSVRPLRLAIWLALASAAGGLLLLIYSVVSFFLIEGTVTGWTSLMATVAILGAAQLLVLGIIGEYVGRILREARGRPTYVIAETETDLMSGETVTKMAQSAE